MRLVKAGGRAGELMAALHAGTARPCFINRQAVGPKAAQQGSAWQIFAGLARADRAPANRPTLVPAVTDSSDRITKSLQSAYPAVAAGDSDLPTPVPPGLRSTRPARGGGQDPAYWHSMAFGFSFHHSYIRGHGRQIDRQAALIAALEAACEMAHTAAAANGRVCRRGNLRLRAPTAPTDRDFFYDTE
jgi:hypothetical protein